MKISIVTVVYNAEATIADAIQSVAEQSHPDVEHIVIDGQSTDNTLSILNANKAHIDYLLSEPDQGIYDAMNKGISLATGDVIGILNADDVYQDNTVLEQVASALADENLDACYADLVYVKSLDMQKVVRNWRSQAHTPGLSFRGWMPAHPTLFLRRRVYSMAGDFNTNLKFQSDLEFCTRIFEVHKISSLYVPKLWVRMRMGGATNSRLSNIIAGNWESYQALKKLGLKRNMLSYFAIKFASRLRQFF